MTRIRPPAMVTTPPSHRPVAPAPPRDNIELAAGTAGIIGGLIALVSLALPWVRVQILFVEQGLTLTGLMDLGRLVEEGFLTTMAGGTMVYVLAAGCAAITCGIAILVATGSLARIAAIALVIEGGVLTGTAMTFALYVAILDGDAWATATPSLGVAAAFLGGLAMVAGGVAMLARRTIAKGHSDRDTVTRLESGPAAGGRTIRKP